MPINWIACALLLSVSCALAEERISVTPATPTEAWFQPELTVRKEAVCDTLLADVREWFFQRHSKTHRYIVSTPAFTEPSRRVYDEGLQIDGNTVRLEPYTNPGCGGACEGYQTLAYTGPPLTRDELRAMPGLHERTPPAGQYTELRRGPGGNYYLIVRPHYPPLKTPESVEAYRLNGDASWSHSCSIALEPDESSLQGDPQFKLIQAQLQSMRVAAREATRSQSTWCSRYGDFLLESRLNSALKRTLYQPWALHEYPVEGNNNWAHTYAKDAENLRIWGLYGLKDHAVAEELFRKVTETKGALTQFYKAKFRWPEQRARIAASVATESAISFAFSFGNYGKAPSPRERLLREALLENRPLKEIRTILALEGPVRGMGGRDPRLGGESVLAVAVRYPAALQLLLEHGADANWRNSFGKTPLMYAVQQNQPESVRILLKAGADPNARTTWPPSYDCYHALSKANMTALHYAARYAGPEIVETLLEHGAKTWFRTQLLNSGEYSETALDWLNKYSSGSEQNLNIPAERLATLATALTPPSEEQLDAMLERTILEAEAEYQQGNHASAFGKLQAVLESSPGNTRALRDMAVVALRQGEVVAALESTKRLLESNQDVSIRAEALFNKGLACIQQPNAQSNYDATYCPDSPISPILESLALQTSSPRRTKLTTLFDGEIKVCLARYRGQDIAVHPGVNLTGAGRFVRKGYAVHHPDTLELIAEDFGWPDPRTPVEVVASYAADGQRVSVVAVAPTLSGSIRVADSACYSVPEQAVSLPCLRDRSCLTPELAAEALRNHDR